MKIIATLALLSALSESSFGLEDNGNGRELRKRRKARKDPDLVFTRGYLCITGTEDFVFLDPTSQNGSGGSTVQSGGCYDPANIQIVNRPRGFEAANPIPTPGVTPLLSDTVNSAFGGGNQPKFVPPRDPSFFLDGECVATGIQVEVAESGGTVITGHSCLLNLCLGGGGYNCLALYAGTKFNFEPDNAFQNGVFNQNAIGTEPPNFNTPLLLPPSYPAAIIGGTGAFQGAKGIVDITTLTGRTKLLARVDGQQEGFITQRVTVTTNVPIPAGP